MKRKPTIYILFFCFTFAGVFAQSPNNEGIVMEGVVSNGDTFLISDLDPVYVFMDQKSKKKVSKSNKYNRMLRKYRRLVYNIKKVYPYSQMAKEKYFALSDELLSMESEKDQKDLIKQVEEEIRDEYEDELKKLTITQGRILLKLIDRELGHTSYDVLKELRGAFSAAFWQTLARIFGSNLKSEFDPNGEDRLMNDIILLIEEGVIKV